ncbi:tetratricopeptide repeat protein [Paracidobacterium acidisoli]|nr:tetratricopeptide repeat protein [Paracidobacterium acidisoli]
MAQNQSPQRPAEITLRGTVLDVANHAVGGAAVTLAQKDVAGSTQTTTGADGAFAFAHLRPGSYTLRAAKPGSRSRMVTVSVSTGDQPQPIQLILQPSSAADHSSSSASPANPSASSADAMEFADQPNFAVAGVTDWTAVGGHGADISLRTSEALTRETLTLRPEDADSSAGSSGAAHVSEESLRAQLAKAPHSYAANHRLGMFCLRAARYREAIPLLDAASRIDPANQENGYDLALALEGAGDLSQAQEQVRRMLAMHDSADLHRLSGELDEKQGDPLNAVHELEHAARLDPSEQNDFEWGSELLLHRAVWQAQEVFRKGAEAYPKSARMLTGLGTALFASGLYDQAAVRICAASDLNPEDPAPYTFLNKIESAAPVPLSCAEPKLARFLEEQPNNALASYFYAMAIWKRRAPRHDPQASQQVESLLTKAVTLDPHCGDAWLQLGTLSFDQGNLQKAIGFYSKAVEADPQIVEAYYRLGVAYDRTGDAAKAKKEFELHEELEKKQAAAIEQQRREVKQFQIVQRNQTAAPKAH